MSEYATKIKDVIEKEPVALFMKGTPHMIMCGNSLRALEALRRAGAPNVKVRHIMELLDESYRRAEGARYRVDEE